MPSAFEQLESWIQTTEYKQLDEAVKSDFILSSNALPLSYQNPDQWVTLDQPFTIQNEPWQVRMTTFVTGTYINNVPVKLAFASLVPPQIIKAGIEADRSSSDYQEVVELYSSVVFSSEFAQLRLQIGALFQKLYPEQGYFFFPMNQSYGLLPTYGYDLILPFFDLHSFKEALTTN